MSDEDETPTERGLWREIHALRSQLETAVGALKMVMAAQDDGEDETAREVVELALATIQQPQDSR